MMIRLNNSPPLDLVHKSTERRQRLKFVLGNDRRGHSLNCTVIHAVSLLDLICLDLQNHLKQNHYYFEKGKR